MQLKTIPLDQIHFDTRNPRTDGTEGLDELAASMQGGNLIVQPPILLLTKKGYRVLVGERRVRAAKVSGATEMICIIQDGPLNALDAHKVRVVENLHRRALNPINRAAALRLSWLIANAKAMNLGKGTEGILVETKTILAAIPKLEALLDKADFKPTAPAVTWNQALDELGVAMSPDRRKKLLRVLAVAQDVQESLQEITISEAAVRALGKLGEDQQREVTEHLLENPELARSVRRIARAVNEQDYSVEEAIAEAEGRTLGVEIDEENEPYEDELLFEGDQAVADAVLAFLENANQVVAALNQVRDSAPGLLDIPEPWRAYYQQSLAMLREELECDLAEASP
jgi:ParB-like chromosome segregation protein Spo0J